MPATHHVVVDGSNLATEGRTVPSLAQLDEAVRAYLAEDPSAEVVVVVDASFSHRIEESERAHLEEAELHGEVVAPPAGAIGRGDAFVLRIAERTGAVVLSNDSFQEFHEEHPWLFDEGRLVGGKPVPGVGWIFTPRRPVRGPRSRKVKSAETEAVEDELSAPRKAAEVAKALKKAAKAAGPGRAKAEAKAPPAKGAKKKADEVAKKPGKKAVASAGAGLAKGAKRTDKGAKKKETPPAPKAKHKRTNEKAPATGVKEKVSRPKKAPAKGTAKKRGSSVRPLGIRAAIDQATEEVLAPAVADGPARAGAGSGKRRRRVEPPPAVNEPLAFITFVAAHPLGSIFDGVVASFTSHGAMVDVALDAGGVLHCYAPLTGLGSPPPRAAREVLTRGQTRPFALVALDPPRRMAELALPERAAMFVPDRTADPRAAG